MSEEWPDEPDDPGLDEPDPEERWGSPEEDLPRVPSAPTPDVEETDVDPELLTTWWRSVALANLALGAVAIGLMLIVFRGRWLVGGGAVVLGLLAGGRLYQHYRAFERERATEGVDRSNGDGKATNGGESTDGDGPDGRNA